MHNKFSLDKKDKINTISKMYSNYYFNALNHDGEFGALMCHSKGYQLSNSVWSHALRTSRLQ